MGALPTLKGSNVPRLAKNILPSLPPLNPRPVWLEPELQYDGREPPKAWLARLRQVQQIHGYNEKEILKIAKKCLRGDAELWFRILQPQSFTSLRTGLHTLFTSEPGTSAVKPSFPSKDHVDEPDIPVCLSSKFVTASGHPSRGRSLCKVRTGDRSGSVVTSSRCKQWSRGRSVSVNSLAPPKSMNGEMSVCAPPCTPPKQLNGWRPVGAGSMTRANLLDGEGSVSGNSRTGASRSFVPHARSDVNTCKTEVLSKPSVKQTFGLNSNPECVSSHSNLEGKECGVVRELNFGFAKSARQSGKYYDKSLESSKKKLDSDILGGDSSDERPRSVGTFALTSMNQSISGKDVHENDERRTSPRGCRSLPINRQQTLLHFKHAIHRAMKRDWSHMSADFCNFYLQCYRIRTSGSRSEQIRRIRDHLELTDGSGTHKYPRNTFVRDCTGGVCVGDVIFFEQRLRQGYDVVSGNLFDNTKRITVGRVVKDSSSQGSEQVFTIEVCWSKGHHAFPPMRPISMRAVDLYRLKPRRQLWINEEARKQIVKQKKIRKSGEHIAQERMVEVSVTVRETLVLHFRILFVTIRNQRES